MIEIRLYSRDGCGLCEEAKDALHGLGRRIALVVKEIDISSDAALEKAYFDKIPVVEIGEAHMFAPIDPHELEQFVRRAEQNQYNDARAGR